MSSITYDAGNCKWHFNRLRRLKILQSMGNLIIFLWLSFKFQLFPVPELHPTHPDGNPEDTDQQEGEDHREVHPEQPVLLPGAGQEGQELVRPRA